MNRILDRWGVTDKKKKTKRKWHVDILKEFVDKISNRIPGLWKLEEREIVDEFCCAMFWLGQSNLQ